jgi:type IV pilus assembly protein PilA
MSTCLVVFLVLLAISVPVLGIMGVLAIYGVRKYLAAANTAEAKSYVTAISRDAMAAYEREITEGRSPTHRLCGSAPPVPAAIPPGIKYQPSSASGGDFHSGSADVGWTCLKFEIDHPIYYQYAYEKGAGSGKSGATASGFEVRARGDLNGDGTSSLFARGADVRGGDVVLSPQIYIENEFE